MPMKIAWTTLPDRAAAQKMAREAVEKGLACCVQVEGPIESFYRWEGKTQTAQEWRLTFKTPIPKAYLLEAWVLEKHPYEVPEWIVVDAARVGEKYFVWANSVALLDGTADE